MNTRIALLAALALVAAPASAQGAVTVGQSPPSAGAPDTCLILGSDPAELFQSAVSSGNSYTVPGPGVITRWSTSLASGGPFLTSLRTYSGLDPVFTPRAQSSPEAIVPGGPTQFDTRIPVAGGELLGLVRSGAMASAQGCYYNTSPSPGDRWYAQTPAASLGQSNTYSPTTGARVNVSAVVEPDCDSDGFGDETQDQDILACGTPQTAITSGPKDKTKKKQATFAFTSDILGSTFECSLDAGPFASCASPHAVTVKKGKHSFAVRAVTSLGNADGSPATDDWKVKKKRKRR